METKEEFFGKITINQQIKNIFPRDQLNASKDLIKYDSERNMYYYEDSLLKNYSIDLYSKLD